MTTSIPDTTASGIYLIAAHPDWRASRVNRRLMGAAHTLATQLPTGRLQIRDLYSSYPDYFIDIEAEQASVQAARLVILMHPIQWYSMPPLQKQWLDDVLTYGWAYGAASAEIGSTEQAPPGTPGTALRGKDLWLVATTGGSQDSYNQASYNRYEFEAFLPPYEQTARLCGMRFLPPLVLHGAHSIGRAEVDAHVELFRDRLQSYPEWAAAAPLSTLDSTPAALAATAPPLSPDPPAALITAAAAPTSPADIANR